MYRVEKHGNLMGIKPTFNQAVKSVLDALAVLGRTYTQTGNENRTEITTEFGVWSITKSD